MASVIRGDWTHRRGDPGGARAVPAELDRPRPAVAWSWRPEHRGRVDQVRIVGEHVVVATMMPRDSSALGWEHAVLYAIDARTGMEVARRALPDPVPVAAMVFAAGMLQVVATRKGEPIFAYALSAADLVPLHRRTVALSIGTSPADGSLVPMGHIPTPHIPMPHNDVLDAWASSDGGLWLELDASTGAEGKHGLAYAFADPDGQVRAVFSPGEELGGEAATSARNACLGEHALFAPIMGRSEGTNPPTAPALSRLDSRGQGGRADTAWFRGTVVGPCAQMHAVSGGGLAYAVAMAQDPTREDRAHIEVVAVDATSGAVQWTALDGRAAVKPELGEAARVVLRPNGELMFQGLDAEGAPSTLLVCARPDGRMDSILLGARGRWVLDASLGDVVLAHRDDESGGVEVGGFAIDGEGRLLGRRAVAGWSIDAGHLGGGTTVYAGAGVVVVRGAQSVCAIRL